MTITERIFVILAQKGLSQKEFAKKIEVNEKTVSAWKKNNSLPPADKISIISDYLEVSVDYLLTGEEKNEKHSFFNNTISNNNNVEFNSVKNGNTTVSNTKYEEIINYLDSLSLRNRRRAELEIIEFLEDKYPIE